MDIGKIVIIINEHGVYQKTLSDTELSLEILRQGLHDNDIDLAEVNLEELS